MAGGNMDFGNEIAKSINAFYSDPNRKGVYVPPEPKAPIPAARQVARQQLEYQKGTGGGGVDEETGASDVCPGIVTGKKEGQTYYMSLFENFPDGTPTKTGIEVVLLGVDATYEYPSDSDLPLPVFKRNNAYFALPHIFTG